jgi:hypothetical protein
MDRIECEDLLAYIREAERRSADARQLGNGEWVVLVEHTYFVWGAEDWQHFRQCEEEEGHAMFDRRVLSKA